MRIGNLTEENTTVATKRTIQHNSNKKLYKNYNNINNSNSNKTQQQQHAPEQQQRNQKSRTFLKMKYSHCNNKNNYSNNSNNNNIGVQLIDGTCLNENSKNTKRTIYENNYMHIYRNNNISRGSSCSSSSNNSNSSKNSSPNLVLTDESISYATTSISKRNPQKATTCHHHHHSQQQEKHCNNNACSFKNHKLFSSSILTESSKMINSPVTPTIYSATWSARNNNNNIYTSASVTHNFNDDNNNNEHKICCQESTLNATSLIPKASAATLSPRSLHHCQTVCIQDSIQLQRRQEQQIEQQNPYIVLSNAKVSSIEHHNLPIQLQQRNLSSSPTANISIASSSSGTSSQIERQQKPQQQLSIYDYPNSYPSLPRTQSTTARTKSSSNPTTTSSSSSLPFPLGNNIANNNNTGTKEYGSKGGGGGKHHFNRKKFWKLNGPNTECPLAIAAAKNSGSESNSEFSIANGIQSCTGSVTDNSNTENNNSTAPKINIRAKNSNNRNQKYQSQTQLQYPEGWKKTSAMTTSVTATVTSSSATNVNAELAVSTTVNKSEDNTNSTSATTTTALSNVTANTSNTVVAKVRSKLEEKGISDVSTPIEKFYPEEKTPQISPMQHQNLPLPMSPINNRSSFDGGGSVNKNYPTGMPSYSLDFLHSVGKKMLAFGTGFPTNAGNRNAPSNNSNSNATGQQTQQSGHRSNRFVTHNNSGYNHGNQHHNHHHPQPQQLTIASFLQKDMFATSGNVRGVANSNTSSNNTITSTNVNMNTETSPHTYGNPVQYPQHRLHNFYNHPNSMPHYYRHQGGGIYPAYNAQNGIISTSTNNSHRYHSSHNSTNNTSSEHTQRQQPPRNQQQRQHMVQQQQQQQQFAVAAATPNRKQKVPQQSKSPASLQNASSPSSSTSSLSSLTSTASSHVGGGSSRQSNASNKSNLRQNSAEQMPPPKNNLYPGGSNACGFRHNNHSRHHNGNLFNHHPGPNVPSPVMGQYQNFNNLTYVITNGNDPTIGIPNQLSNLGSNSHALNAMSCSESSSRACSPSILSSSDNLSPEPSQALLLGVPNRFVHPEQQAFIINTTNMRPPGMCPPALNMGHNEHVTCVGKQQETEKADSGCNECGDSECSSLQQSEEECIQRCNSFHQARPASSLSQSSQTINSQVPSPIEFTFNPLMHQQLPPASMHFQPQPYRNGIMPPNVANLQPSSYHEDEFNIHGAIQQQMPSIFFTPTDQMNSGSGQPGNIGYPNAGNVVYSQSAMTLIGSCPSTASNISRSNEEDQQIMSSRSSSSGSDQHKGSTPDISSDVLNEMHDQMGVMNRVNSGANTLPSARSRSARIQQHSHPIPPPFMHYPFNQQSMFCSNYLAYLRSTPSNTSSDLNSNTPPDRFMSRSHLVEVKETPPTLLNSSKWDNLSQQIWSKFMDAQQTEETFKLKMRLWRYLYVTIKQTYPRYGLYLVGSTMSGFGADTSDVDMCLVSRSFAFVEQRMEALFNLTILRECLRKTEDFESFNLIEAKVPILRFRDKSNHFEVDLNFNNSVGIKNTHLLYCYTQLDWRLRPLALIVKLWAQYHDINNAKNMTISSYSLVLMVIHFLQCGASPPVLPCLHKMFPEKFTPLRSNEFGHVDMNDNVGPYESKNAQAIGELFLNFLEYYSSFDYRQNAISVRTGGLLPVNVCRQAKSLKNDIHQWKELCIEEPFDLTNTARSVYDFDTFERVKAVFSTSFHVLQKTLELNSIFAPLVLPRLPISARIYMKRTPIAPNVSLIPKTTATDTDDTQSQKNLSTKNNDNKSNAIPSCGDDEARIEEKSAGCGDVAPATATAL